MTEQEGYRVVVYTKRHPNSFRGPQFLRNILSTLSEEPNAFIGDNLLGMPLEKAQEIAKSQTNNEGYIDGHGRLRTCKGVVRQGGTSSLFD